MALPMMEWVPKAMLYARHPPFANLAGSFCSLPVLQHELSTQLHTASEPFLHRIFYPSISSSHTSTVSLCPALRVLFALVCTALIFKQPHRLSDPLQVDPSSSSLSLSFPPHVFATSLPPLVPIAMECSPDILTSIGSNRALRRSTTLNVVSKRRPVACPYTAERQQHAHTNLVLVPPPPPSFPSRVTSTLYSTHRSPNSHSP